jgi:hypothetical protein
MEFCQVDDTRPTLSQGFTKRFARLVAAQMEHYAERLIFHS